MRFKFILLTLFLFSFSDARNSIQLTTVNDWTTTDQVLGIDFFQSASTDLILAVCSQNSLLRAYDTSSGQPSGITISLDSSNEYPWGVVSNGSEQSQILYVNDMVSGDIYFTDDSGNSWSTLTNPTAGAGRGMDFDGIDYWTCEGGGLTRFQPGGSHQYFNTNEIPTQSSGLTVFPYGNDLAIAVTAYTTHAIYFYIWDGSEISFLNSVDCPVSGIATSFGLAYAGNETIFWTYKDSSNEYHLAKLSYSIQFLEQFTWAAIKAIH